MQQLMFENPLIMFPAIQRFVYHPERYITMSKLSYKYDNEKVVEKSLLTLLLTDRLVDETREM